MPQGVLLRAELDEEFWLNFGLDSSISVWFGGNDSMIAAPPVSVAARFASVDRMHLGGLLWPEAAARLEVERVERPAVSPPVIRGAAEVPKARLAEPHRRDFDVAAGEADALI